MLQVYGDERSGNCLKVKWTLDYFQRPYRWHHVDILAGETRTGDFLAKNPEGQIPLLVLGDGRSLSQSNAIVLFLCEQSTLVPSCSLDRARALQWLFWEQYSHEPYLAVRRFQKLYLEQLEADIEPKLLHRGMAALNRMELQLLQTPFLIGKEPSVADLCLLPYTALAPEGGFDLAAFPKVRSWVGATAAAFNIATLNNNTESKQAAR